MENGIVVRSTGSFYTVESRDGSFIECKLKGKFKTKGIKNTNPIAVGDLVEFEMPDDVGLITKIEPRRNYIIRKSTNLSKQHHIIASNIDQAVLIISLIEPRTTTGFIDRFLITAEAYSIPAILVFNKLDIYSSEQIDELEKLTNIYSSINYETLHVSAKTGLNLETLKSILKGKKSLFSGHSGVGKSALVNAMDASQSLKIGEVSQYHLKGKHTTTYATMHHLNFGAHIIDTPGIKEFGLLNFHVQELSHYFPEMRQYLGKCKFNDCTHDQEPGCTVKLAVMEGDISQERYTNYLKILHDEELLQWENQFKE